MIIELAGMPCSGKTSNIYNYSLLFKAEIITNHLIQKELKLCLNSKIINLILIDIILVLRGLRFIGRKNLILLLDALKLSGWNYLRRLNVLRNTLKKYAIFELFSKYEERNFLVDEGISQIVYNFATSKNKISNSLLLPYLKNSKLKVIHIICDNEEIRKRLSIRGHKMIRYYGIENFLILNNKAKRNLITLLKKINK